MRRLIIALVVLLSATHVQAADRAVPGTYATINAALAAAVSGDRIMIAPGTYTECVTLPNKGALGTAIIIRSSTADGNLPAANVRINPTYSAVMATIRAANTGCPAISTDVAAQDYQIGPGIKLEGPSSGYRGGAEIGANTSSQMLEADQPQDITFDRVWIKGDDWTGMKVGIDMNGRNLAIRNSYIEDVMGVSQDAVGIRCFNGSGPITIYNNYINAAGYGFICGGDQPYMMQFSDASAATTTTATLTNIVNRSGGTHLIGTLHVGQYISVLANGGTIRYHPKVISCGTSTPGASCTSASITFEAIPVAPDTGTAGDIQWGTIPTGISIRRNNFQKSLTWNDNILATPAISSTSASTSSGSLPAGTYFYKVQATYCCYQTARIYSTAAAEATRVLSATGQITVNWGAVSGPSNITYRIFRSTTSGAYAGYIDVGNVTSYVDTGTALTGTSAPASGTNWLMKNMMEIKYAVDVQIDSNIFEHSWVGGESGYAIWFKSNNYGTGNYMHTRNVVFEKNVMDGMDGCFSILGRIDSSGSSFTRPIENLTIRNNICFDSNTNWMQGKSAVYAIKIQSPVVGLTIDNNTFQHTMGSFMYVDKTTTAGSIPSVSNFSLRNNLFRKGQYGLFGESCTAGNATECFTEFVTGTSPFDGNCVGGSSMTMPTGNTLVSSTIYEGSTNFESYQATGGVIANFALKTGAPCKTAGVGGSEPGANISLISTATNGVSAGSAEGTSTPDITTASPLTSVVEDVAMSQQCIAATGGSTPYNWSFVSGQPAGTVISSSTGCITGTPTTPGTYTVNVRVLDSSGPQLSDTQAFQWVITATSPTLTITTTTLATKVLAESISTQIVATGGTPPYTFSVNTGSSLPSWLTLSPSGLLSGVPTATGTFNFTLRVDDAVAANDTQALSQVVNPVPESCGRRAYFIFNGIMVARAAFVQPTEPLTSAPTCARKGDVWIDTATDTTKVARQVSPSDPLVWAIDSTDQGNLVGLDTTTPPSLGALITGTSDGQWTISNGLDASSITTGTIDPDRLPGGSSGGAGGSTVIVPFHVATSASNTWTNMPSAETELLDTTSKRQMFDTTPYTQIWMTMRVQGSGAAGATCYPKFSLNDSTFTAVSGITISLATSGTKGAASGWVTIPEAAKTTTTIWSVWCSGGDGVADPAIGSGLFQFR